MREVPARPGRGDVDPLLGATSGVPLIVVGSDADLAAVVVRIMRKNRLGDTPVGYVPVDPASPVARLWGLPASAAEALALARDGANGPRVLVRDDSGGVLMGEATIGPVTGEAYCDDVVALRGSARSVVVRPGPEGVRAEVTRGLLRRTSSVSGRAFQLGCNPAELVSDGVAHPRPVTRCTWYRHTEDLMAITDG
ncbi:hypothetical protein GCM10027445_64310 [Amycolatopsis endophytica]|uniref:Uncharacterized protein n=1 Tax=Amycolatopsis endophytica TaxID=860233 RepID=A0A853B168_9PSEU|nr:hypothetical protein [Amycolatopsis endophytica]NYI88689.1 hypothetical protein [Amycolatopsis endophytica]